MEERKFFKLQGGLRKVEEVAQSLKQYRGQSSKEYFRSLAIKYFVQWPNVKVRLLEKLRGIQEITLNVIVNNAPFSRKYSFLALIQAFAVYSKEHFLKEDNVTNNMLDFVEFLDCVESMAEETRVIWQEDTKNSQKLKQFILRVLIKDYFSGKSRKKLRGDVNRVNKLYKISYIDLNFPCHSIDKQIVIEFDQGRKSNLTKFQKNNNVNVDSRLRFNCQQIQKQRKQLLKRYFGQDQYDNMVASCKPHQKKASDTKLQSFIKDWIGSMDVSLSLFEDKQNKYLKQL